MIFSRRCLLFLALLIAVCFAAFGILPRLRAERENKTIAFVVEYKDMISLSSQSGREPLDVWREIASKGVHGITIIEYTGEELMNLSPMPLKFGAAGALGVGDGEILPDNAVLIMDSNSPYAQLICDYLKIKMPNVRVMSAVSGETVLILPGTTDIFRQSAFIPDFLGLELCSANDIPILFRPGPCLVSDGERVAMSLSWLAKRYPIKSIVPSGAVMAGYPQLTPIARTLKEEGVSLAQVEFVKQVGVAGMAALMAPEVLPLHSLTREEIVSRRMTRPQIRERLVRAVHERSVRLLIMRPYDLQMGNRLAVLTEDLETVKSEAEALGYSFGWPKTLTVWSTRFAGAIACALSFLFCLWFYSARLLGAEEGRVTGREIACLSLLSLCGAVLLLKITIIARLAGGFGTAFVATEAALCAMGYYKKPVKGLLLGLFIVIAGGLSAASFYGSAAAALRLTPFSGVKLTLLLPPLLILLHDFRRRVHPESIGEIMVRPAIWSELALVGAMLLALLVMALRSDNVSSVPGWETAFRNFMERLLLVRPRTKEFTIGYPALILYYYIMSRGWAARYREAMRIAASVAFSSAVNTFCHFHTALVLSLIRVTIGWGAGIIVGVAAVALLHYAAVPLWKKGLREVFR